jgi:8-oxo-dGTP diphosphatase
MVNEVTQSSHGRQRGDVQVAPRPTVRAAGLIFGDAGLLLVRQRRLDRDYWLLPGGGVHFGESLTAALRRELREELCLEIEPGRPVALAEAISADMAAYPNHVVHVVLQATLVDATARPRLGGDAAVLEARFFTREELAALAVTPPITPFLQSCFEGLPQEMRYLGVVW